MPMKRRISKRRAPEAPAWATFFACGWDFFDDLRDFGMTEAEAAEVAEDAWRQHGAAFMASWQPQPNRALPWAAEQFGVPECR
jgi:hypothetical protein